MGGDLTYDVAAGNTVTQSFNAGAGEDPEALGSFIKTGAGTLILEGAGSTLGSLSMSEGSMSLAQEVTLYNDLIVGGGALTISAASIVRGTTMVSGGLLAQEAMGSIEGDLLIGGGTLMISNNATLSVQGDVTVGSGPGSANLILSGGTLFSENGKMTIVENGQITLSGEGGNIAMPEVNWMGGELNFETSATYDWGTETTGTVAVNILGAVNQTSYQSYAGTTTIHTGGTLSVQAGFDGSMLILNGGTLSQDGSGNLKVDTLILQSGNVNGMVFLNAGSLFQTGGGTTTMTSSYGEFSEEVVGIYNGTLLLVDSALEDITQLVVGQNAGDSGTLHLVDSSLTPNTPGEALVLGGNAGAEGTLVLEQREAASSGLNYGMVKSGAGSGTVILRPGAAKAMLTTFVMDGNLSVVHDGAGATTLAAESTYGGGTVVESGRLIAGADGSMGSGSITVKGGTFVVPAEVNVLNTILLSGGSYEKDANGGSNMAGMIQVTSSLQAGIKTTASTLAGVLSDTASLVSTYEGDSTAVNDGIRKSDVFFFTGSEMNLYVLQLGIESLPDNGFLGWFDDEVNLWRRAMEGNSGNTASLGQLDYQGSFSDFQSIYGTSLDEYVGAYGTDNSGAVWAVLDYDGRFAVVPEPAALQYLLIAVFVCGTTWMTRRASRGRTSGV